MGPLTLLHIIEHLPSGTSVMRHCSPSHETAISQAGKPSQNLKMGFDDPSTYTEFLLKFTH